MCGHGSRLSIAVAVCLTNYSDRKIFMKVVLCGAGKIGRGIIVKSVLNAGHTLTILDVNQPLIDLLNQAGSYTVHSLDQNLDYMETVTGYSAYVFNTEQAGQAILSADLILISVGLNNIESLLKSLLPFMKQRVAVNKAPVDMIFCENYVGIRAYVERLLSEKFQVDPKIFDGLIGFAGGSVGVVVPPPENPLNIIKGPYEDIHIEAKALITDFSIPHFVPVKNFELNIREKLYIYNMAHAMTSYLGWLYNYEYVDQAYMSKKINTDVRKAMEASALALAKEYDVDYSDELLVVNDIERRICNDRIRDTVVRIAADPVRKLAPDDRLTGTLKLTLKHNTGHEALLKGIAAAFRFDAPGDVSANVIQAFIAKNGVKSAITRFTGLTDQKIVAEIIFHYNSLK
jgi:mannitol-1-phosphate 5-dehydrogenase